MVPFTIKPTISIAFNPIATLPRTLSAVLDETVVARTIVFFELRGQKPSLANEHAARAEFVQQIFVSVNCSYNFGGVDVAALPSVGHKSPIIKGTRFYSTIFVRVTVSLYDGRIRDARLPQAHAAADGANSRMMHPSEDAVRQAVIADTTPGIILSAYAASRGHAIAIQTTFDAALAVYRSGLGSITDLALVESQPLQAENAYTDACSMELSTSATLARSTSMLGATPE